LVFAAERFVADRFAVVVRVGVEAAGHMVAGQAIAWLSDLILDVQPTSL
jgi:hypothetical protein